MGAPHHYAPEAHASYQHFYVHLKQYFLSSPKLLEILKPDNQKQRYAFEVAYHYAMHQVWSKIAKKLNVCFLMVQILWAPLFDKIGQMNMQSADSPQSVNSSVCDIPLGEQHYPWAVILEFHPGGRGKIVDGTTTLSKSGIKVYLTISTRLRQ